jgi:hypothetical protein
MQKVITIVLLMIAGSMLFAQNTDDWLWGEEEEEKPAQEIKDPEFIKVNYEKKDARLAMIYSMLLPGAGSSMPIKAHLRPTFSPSSRWDDRGDHYV